MAENGHTVLFYLIFKKALRDKKRISDYTVKR